MQPTDLRDNLNQRHTAVWCTAQLVSRVLPVSQINEGMDKEIVLSASKQATESDSWSSIYIWENWRKMKWVEGKTLSITEH